MNTSALFPVFCELLLKSAAVLALAFAVVAAWRRASSASRHMVWAFAMATLLALPLTRLARPQWTVDLPAVTVRIAPSPTSVAPAPSVVEPAARTPSTAPSRSPFPWRSALLVAWLSVAAGIAGYRLLGAWQLLRLRRRSVRLDDERIRSVARSLSAGSGRLERLELRCAPSCRVPLAWGILRPVVLLPDEARDWPEPRLAAALCHEMGHIRRGDGITRLFADLACSLYWVNPLIWLAAGRLRTAQEQACDDLVLSRGADAADYANLLVQSARGFGFGFGGVRHALAMAKHSTLETRICAIVDTRRNRRPPGLRALALGAMTVLAVAAASALAQVETKPDVNGPQILISAKFMEVDDGIVDRPELQKLLKAQATLTIVEAGDLMKALEKTKGVDILSTPRVTTLSKQEASIKIVREMVSPTDWEPGGKSGDWKPKTFTTNEVGISFVVKPEWKEDGTIVLDMAPEIVELLGYIDLDDGEKQLPPTAEAPKGHRVQPVFSSREIKSKVAVKSGQTVVLGGSVREEIVLIQDKVPVLGDIPLLGRLFRDEKEATVKRQLWILVTAEQVKPDEMADSVIVTADTLAHDKATGETTVSGNVRIETPQAVIRADTARIKPVNRIEQKAAEIVIPALDFNKEPLPDAISWIVDESRKADPEGKGVNVILQMPPGAKSPRITAHFRNISLLEAIQYAAKLGGLELKVDNDAIRIQPPDAER